MSSDGNIFHVTGPLCGEFTGHRWIPHTQASDVQLWYFLWSVPWINGWVNNRKAGDLRRHPAHYDVIVMKVWVVNIIWYGRQGHVYATQSTLCLLMIWQCKEPGYQQQWYWPGLMGYSDLSTQRIYPLRAKFFRVNINMYLHFMSFLRTHKTQVVEIPPRVRQGPAYTT